MSTESWSPENGAEFVPNFLGSLRLRIAASAALVTGGVVFVLLYLAFFASRYAWYQNLAVVFSATLIVPVAVVVLWITWGLGIARKSYRSFWD